ncbi:hypothetical protein [Moorena producens]
MSQELVRFDTQKLQNPEVSGVEYHGRGTIWVSSLERVLYPSC